MSLKTRLARLELTAHTRLDTELDAEIEVVVAQEIARLSAMGSETRQRFIDAVNVQGTNGAGWGEPVGREWMREQVRQEFPDPSNRARNLAAYVREAVDGILDALPPPV